MLVAVMAVLTVRSKHSELRRVSRCFVDDNDQPIGIGELVSSCSCGAEIVTEKKFPELSSHDARLRDHQASTFVVFVHRPGWMMEWL